MEAQKVEQNSRKIACLFVEQERLKSGRKMETCNHDFMLRENTPKLTLFGLLFSHVLTQEKIIEMVFFSIISSIKSNENFESMATLKAYLKDFFFERLCLA